MRRPLVAGNWKMHGSSTQNSELVSRLIDMLDARWTAEVLVCPTFVHLRDVGRQLNGSGIELGAQSLCAEEPGAFTGEVCGAMLKEIGCKYVVVGHSERRALYHEDDSLVARKFVAAQREGLTPVLCVGETLAEREAGNTTEVVGRQLDAVMDVAGVDALANAVLAYEPVWAIGTGKTATPDQAQDVHKFIRGRVSGRDAKIADSIRILYGGSVKAANAAELFGMDDVDGGLVGGASLKAEEFAGICKAAG